VARNAAIGQHVVVCRESGTPTPPTAAPSNVNCSGLMSFSCRPQYAERIDAEEGRSDHGSEMPNGTDQASPVRIAEPTRSISDPTAGLDWNS